MPDRGGGISNGDVVMLKAGNGKYVVAESGGALFGNRDAAFVRSRGEVLP
jgi:hypothetical protein